MHNSLPTLKESSTDEPQPLPADSTSTPTVQPMTLAVVPPASLSAEEQLAYLTRELDKLNAQTSELVRRQPSVGRVYQQQLAEMFPDAHLPINQIGRAHV